MAAKTKRQVTSTRRAVPATAAEFGDAVNECAVLQLEQERNKAALNDLLARTGETLRAQIDAADKEIKERMEALHTYANLHREELFGRKRKSAETSQATYGFADNPSKIIFLSRDWNDETCIAALRNLDKAGFVRVTEEINRDALKEALREAAAMEEVADKPEGWKPQITVAELRMAGLKLSQSERFYLDPHRVAQTTSATVTV